MSEQMPAEVVTAEVPTEVVPEEVPAEVVTEVPAEVVTEVPAEVVTEVPAEEVTVAKEEEVTAVSITMRAAREVLEEGLKELLNREARANSRLTTILAIADRALTDLKKLPNSSEKSAAILHFIKVKSDENSKYCVQLSEIAYQRELTEYMLKTAV